MRLQNIFLQKIIKAPRAELGDRWRDVSYVEFS